MLTPVEFNDQPSFPTSEISEVWGYRKLANKLVTAKLAVLQFVPKPAFREIIAATK